MDPHQLWIDVMQRAEVTVEVCHVVEESGEPSKKRRTTIGKRSRRSKPKLKKAKQVDSDWETPTSEWEEEEDELNASQYLQEDNLNPALVKKRSAEDTLPGTNSENGPAAKRLRTDLPEIG